MHIQVSEFYSFLLSEISTKNPYKKSIPYSRGFYTQHNYLNLTVEKRTPGFAQVFLNEPWTQ